MKKSIALFVAFAFVVTVASVAFGRTLDEEKQAVRDYLKVVDAKIVKYRKAGNTAKVKMLQGEKQATLARWNKLQAEMAASEVAPPPPAPVPPPVMKPAPAAYSGWFGWGWNTDVSVGYLMGKSVITGRANLVLADPFALGPMLGLSQNAISWKLGLGGLSGKDTNDVEKKAVPIYFDGVIALPADMLGGVESYIGAGVNYAVYGSGKTAGSYGGQIYYGLCGDIGLGGKSFAELGYGIVRSGTAAGHYSMKGLTVNFGTSITL